jgi:hypothetical protein
MVRLSRTTAAVLFLGGLVTHLGCSAKPPGAAPPASAGAAVIGKTKAAYGIWGDRLAVVIWFDTSFSSAGLSVEGDAVLYQGMSAPPEGPRTEWRCRTSDGRTGTIRIGGGHYDLARGALFLVATRGGEIRVSQIDRDLSGLQAGREGLEVLARDVPEITRFVAKAANQAPGP